MQNFFDLVKPNLATIAAESEIVSGTTRRLLAEGYYNAASYRSAIEPALKRALSAYMELLCVSEDNRISNFAADAVVELRSATNVVALRADYLHVWQARGHRNSFLGPTICAQTRAMFRDSPFRVSPPYDMYYLCIYAPGTSPYQTVDHDNLDLKSVCDAFSQCLGFDDNGLNVGIVCRSAVTDEVRPGYYCLLLPQGEDGVCLGISMLIDIVRELGFE